MVGVLVASCGHRPSHTCCVGNTRTHTHIHLPVPPIVWSKHASSCRCQHRSLRGYVPPVSIVLGLLLMPTASLADTFVGQNTTGAGSAPTCQAMTASPVAVGPTQMAVRLSFAAGVTEQQRRSASDKAPEEAQPGIYVVVSDKVGGFWRGHFKAVAGDGEAPQRTVVAFAWVQIVASSVTSSTSSPLQKRLRDLALGRAQRATEEGFLEYKVDALCRLESPSPCRATSPTRLDYWSSSGTNPAHLSSCRRALPPRRMA